MKRLSLTILTMTLVWGLACTKAVDTPKDPDIKTETEDAGGQEATPDTPDQPAGDNLDKAPNAKGSLKDGMKSGPWVYFHADDVKAAEGPYEKDLKHGKWTYWYANGKKAAEGQFSKGEKTGPWKSWDEEGKEITKQVYVEGLRPTK
ncbi:MAG: hypothetical protein JRF33_10290 [Deltaproteobacteria bacterium]|nr:hypothetical protein [Deltaproteobacteria bacterium]